MAGEEVGSLCRAFGPSRLRQDGSKRGARGENPLAFCEGLSGAPASEESSFRKAHDARPRDDEMVEDLNVDQG